MNIFKRLFGKKKKMPDSVNYTNRPIFPRGVSGNSLKDSSSKSEDDYWNKRKRDEWRDPIDLTAPFYPHLNQNNDPGYPSPSNESHFGGYGGGDSGGGGASGSWSSDSSDSGSYDSGSSDSGGGCDSGGSSD